MKIAAAAGKMEVMLGECTLEVGDMPDKEAAIRAALDHGAPPPPKDSTPPKAQHGKKRNSTIPPQAP
jgi:hypothetical protein